MTGNSINIDSEVTINTNSASVKKKAVIVYEIMHMEKKWQVFLPTGNL